MTLINGLSNTPNQQITLVLDNGQKVQLTLNFFANQNVWVYSINYNNGQFVDNNRNLVMSPNMLTAFQNIIPFGLACIVSDGEEPVAIDDLTSGRVSLYLLNQADVAEVEVTILNAN